MTCPWRSVTIRLAAIAGCAIAFGLPGRAAGQTAHDPADVDPLAITSEMRDFLAEHAPRDMARQVRLLELQDAMFDPEQGLGIEYGSHGTRTAAQAFSDGRGNCLSFTLLFVALAREAGLNPYFVEVAEVTGWSQRGSVGFSHWHMFAEVEIDNGFVQVDFLPWLDRRYRSSRRIDEQRARAHFFNNVGAETLSDGDVKLAVAYFERALEFDSTFVPAKINFAVAMGRQKRHEEAIDLLLEVLDDEPRNVVAAANLASRYLAQGRDSEARDWLARRQSFLDDNPFHHFKLGLRALETGDAQQARQHFKRAITRQRDEAIFFEQLAEAHLRLGAERKARSALRRALDLTEDPGRREQIEARLRLHPLQPSGIS